jgi:hypothetical protein
VTRLLISLVVLVSTVCAGEAPTHVVVYREAGRLGGWPANHGIWSWGNEILVGFSAAYHKVNEANRHQQDHSKPEEPRLARSLDGGRTWAVDANPDLLPPAQGGREAVDLKEPMDFTRPGFAMTIRFMNNDSGPSLLWFTYDKGRRWQGPFRFPQFGKGIAARTDYIVESKRSAIAFVTQAKDNGREGRPVCVRTTDGGLTWKLVSPIGDEPSGFSIMPSTVRLPDATLLSTVRVHEGESNRIDAYVSHDNGSTWTLRSQAAETGAFNGNPPSLLRLKDGRLCVTYGYRSEPYSIRARFSSDGGKTWGDVLTIRGDGAAWDLGYPRTVQRPDGKLVTVYYFNDAPHTERFIAATIWEAPK